MTLQRAKNLVHVQPENRKKKLLQEYQQNLLCLQPSPSVCSIPNFSPLAQIVYELCSLLCVKLIIEKETDLASFFLLIRLLMKISKSRKRAKQNFLSPKKLSKITFLKLCYLNISSNFELIELYLFFSKFFSEIVNSDFENLYCRNSGLP